MKCVKCNEEPELCTCAPSDYSEKEDMVNHPKHYNSHPSGVECIAIIRHMTHNCGAAIKYVWRAGLKQEAKKSSKEKHIEDIEKAIFYLKDEVNRLKGE